MGPRFCLYTKTALETFFKRGIAKDVAPTSQNMPFRLSFRLLGVVFIGAKFSKGTVFPCNDQLRRRILAESNPRLE